MTYDDHIMKNISSRTFYHGARCRQDAIAIAKEGFKTRFYDEADDEWYFRSGTLGRGTYITCNINISLWYSKNVLVLTLKPGTRIADIGPQADIKTISRLTREFGREILEKEPRKVIPHNKHLTDSELIELTRYHYHKSCKESFRTAISERGFSYPTSHVTKRLTIKHDHLQNCCVQIMKKRGIHGYGKAGDGDGIVIFAPDRVIVKELIAFNTSESDRRLIHKDPEPFKSLESALSAIPNQRYSVLEIREGKLKVDD